MEWEPRCHLLYSVDAHPRALRNPASAICGDNNSARSRAPQLVTAGFIGSGKLHVHSVLPTESQFISLRGTQKYVSTYYQRIVEAKKLMAESVQSRAQRMSAEVRRQQIVAVAADLFSKKGFSGTTTKEIADGAGV